MRSQGLWFEARPDRTLSPGSGQKMGSRGPSGRLASAKLVIHVKYSIFIYLSPPLKFSFVKGATHNPWVDPQIRYISPKHKGLSFSVSYDIYYPFAYISD